MRPASRRPAAGATLGKCVPRARRPRRRARRAACARHVGLIRTGGNHRTSIDECFNRQAFSRHQHTRNDGLPCIQETFLENPLSRHFIFFAYSFLCIGAFRDLILRRPDSQRPRRAHRARRARPTCDQCARPASMRLPAPARARAARAARSAPVWVRTRGGKKHLAL